MAEISKSRISRCRLDSSYADEHIHLLFIGSIQEEYVDSTMHFHDEIYRKGCHMSHSAEFDFFTLSNGIRLLFIKNPSS